MLKLVNCAVVEDFQNILELFSYYFHRVLFEKSMALDYNYLELLFPIFPMIFHTSLIIGQVGLEKMENEKVGKTMKRSLVLKFRYSNEYEFKIANIFCAKLHLLHLLTFFQGCHSTHLRAEIQRK